MAQYFFHLRNAIDAMQDYEGTELPNLDAARKMALDAARDTLSHDMLTGALDLSYRIDVEDGRGMIVHTLPLRDSFAVIS